MSRFPACLAITLRHEGGYVDHPRDPGGATNMGVTIGTLSMWLGRPAKKAEVKALSVADVTPIYRDRYWNPCHAEDCPPGLDLCGFDGSVNSGVSRGIRWVQKAVGAAADGRWGPETARKVSAAWGDPRAVQRACAARMAFLQGLGTWSTFGRGWSRRVADIEAHGVRMAGATPVWMEDQADVARGKSRAQESAAGGAGAAGGGVTLMDAPWQAALTIAALALAVAVLAHLKARHNRTRAAAYAAVAKETPDA